MTPPRARGRTASIAVLLVVIPFAYVIWRQWMTAPRPVDLTVPSIGGIAPDLPPANGQPPRKR